MGIPHLFRHFARRCPRAIKVVDASSSCSFSELHIDFNSVIHSCAREVLQEHASNDDEATTEIRIVEACMAHVAWLVARFRPTALVHVAVDGAPPRAKMSQQRSRRYLKHLKHQSIASPPSPLWDSNVVTPGTPFMRRLDEALHASLETRIREECVRRSVSPPQRVLVSGSDEPGEGEQKIFMGLRRASTHNGGGKSGVYGLDADLLLMSMSHPLRDRLVILREQDLKGPVQLVDAAVLAKHAASEIAKLRWVAPGPAGPAIIPGDDKESADVAEYVALCTLLGNDFVPSLPGLSIRHGGIDEVLAAYGRAIRAIGANGGTLARGGPTALAGFNLTVLSSVVHELSEHEDRALETRERHHASALVAASKKRTPTEDDYPLLPSTGPHPMVYPGVPGWRPRYYRQVFFARKGSPPTQSDVDETCIEYVMALAWSFAYLSRQECVSVGWHYRHPHAPTALDVRKSLLGNELAVGGSPFAPSGIAESAFRSADQLHRQGEKALGSAVWQLLHVLPPQTHATLFSPSSLAGRIATDPRLGCVHLFPSSFGLVTYLKEKLHECVPILPEVDPQLLIRAVTSAM